MSTFAPPAITVAELDPFKHVNYMLGMILGEEDFRQEFSYLSGRDQWLARSVLGYGTLCGLRVSGERGGAESGWNIYVDSGAALSPRGQMIRVPTRQCAQLNPWLDAHRSEVLQRVGSPPENAQLYVVLCYRECPVDPVPIPGEPCRSEDDTRKPSRMVDDYHLELTWELPEQRQEDGIQEFVTWLRQIPVEDALDSTSNFDAFDAALRAVVPVSSPVESPPMSPPEIVMSSPPEDLFIPRGAIDRYLRHAFMLWTTALRPLWLGTQELCSGRPPREDCVLLAELQVPLAANGMVSDTDDVMVLEDRRPYLLSLRMVQELMLHLSDGTGGELASPLEAGGVLMGDVLGPANTSTVVGIQGVPVTLGSPLEAAGNYLQFMGTEWVLANPRNDLPRVVAAGRFDANGKSTDAANFSFNNLQLRRIDYSGRSLYFMRFDGFDPARHYVINATVINTPDGATKDVDVVDMRDMPVPPTLQASIDTFNATAAGVEGDIEAATDLIIRTKTTMPIPLPVNSGVPGLMVEITQYQ